LKTFEKIRALENATKEKKQSEQATKAIWMHAQCTASQHWKGNNEQLLMGNFYNKHRI